MSTVTVMVRIQLSAESAPAYAEAAKAIVAATRQEDGCEWYGIASDVYKRQIFGGLCEHSYRNGPDSAQC